MRAAVHPRLRGERAATRIINKYPDGSSPLARGTPHGTDADRRQHRFIPACAGNATARWSSAPRVAVHPRLRGERTITQDGAYEDVGSSPLARGTRLARIAPQEARPVHPRLRGERIDPTTRVVSVDGSSPLARGTHQNDVTDRGIYRFIPACAGNARVAGTLPGACPVHPRLRGERRSRLHLDRKVDGSSPLARGTQLLDSLASTLLRFIPACAGNAADQASHGCGPPVHPRLRGERETSSSGRGTHIGSSPLARGTRIELEAAVINARFIPACAGNA